MDLSSQLIFIKPRYNLFKLQNSPVKYLSKTALILYVSALLWLVFFKFSYDILSVLAHYQSRSLNLIPFAGLASGGMREMIENFVVFIPFGLLLSVNFKRITFGRKLACIFIFSVAVEALQFVLAIGTTDITDIITNTTGGLFGLLLYEASNRLAGGEKRDRFIAITLLVLLAAIIYLRVFVMRVRY